MKATSKLGSIALAACEIVVGILLLIDPVSFTKTILAVLGGILILMGAASVIQYFRASPTRAATGKGLARGCIEAALGLFCITKNGWVMATFPVLTVVYGVVTLISGFTKLQWTVDMARLKMKKWGASAISAGVTLLCSFIILAQPFYTTTVLWKFIGAALIIEAVVDLVAAFLAKPGENEIIW